MAEARSQTADGENERAVEYLSSFTGTTMRVTTTDGRMFVGTMKCTDRDRNIILSLTHEYREALAAEMESAAQKAERSGNEKFKLPMTSRFVGQVVVPGQHITRIEKMNF